MAEPGLEPKTIESGSKMYTPVSLLELPTRLVPGIKALHYWGK